MTIIYYVEFFISDCSKNVSHKQKVLILCSILYSTISPHIELEKDVLAPVEQDQLFIEDTKESDRICNANCTESECDSNKVVCVSVPLQEEQQVLTNYCDGEIEEETLYQEEIKTLSKEEKIKILAAFTELTQKIEQSNQEFRFEDLSKQEFESIVDDFYAISGEKRED